MSNYFKSLYFIFLFGDMPAFLKAIFNCSSTVSTPSKSGNKVQTYNLALQLHRTFLGSSFSMDLTGSGFDSTSI